MIFNKIVHITPGEKVLLESQVGKILFSQQGKCNGLGAARQGAGSFIPVFSDPFLSKAFDLGVYKIV